jgi:hypothetical protein
MKIPPSPRLLQDRSMYGGYPTNSWYGWYFSQEEKQYVYNPELLPKVGDGETETEKGRTSQPPVLNIGRTYEPTLEASQVGKVQLLGYSSGGHMTSLFALRNHIAKSNGCGGDDMMRIRVQEEVVEEEKSTPAGSISKPTYRLVRKPAVSDKVHLLSPVADLQCVAGAPREMFENAYTGISILGAMSDCVGHLFGAVFLERFLDGFEFRYSCGLRSNGAPSSSARADEANSTDNTDPAAVPDNSNRSAEEKGDAQETVIGEKEGERRDGENLKEGEGEESKLTQRKSKNKKERRKQQEEQAEKEREEQRLADEKRKKIEASGKGYFAEMVEIGKTLAGKVAGEKNVDKFLGEFWGKMDVFQMEKRRKHLVMAGDSLKLVVLTAGWTFVNDILKKHVSNFVEA